MRNLFIFTFFSFLLASITTIAFEERKELNDINILYKLNADLDDLVLKSKHFIKAFFIASRNVIFT